MPNTTETAEQRAERLVRQEVQQCLSSLVYTLATGYGEVMPGGDLGSLAGQAFELSCPILDYEGAAEEKGWAERSDRTWARKATANEIECEDFEEGDSEDASRLADTAEDACELDGIEPHDREVFEHWAVSDWFGRQLEAAGERVDFDFAGMTVWARTTTGQMISMDGVIQRIAAELLKA